MYQAIEAISTAGVIRPLEPILFDENEHLVILRLSKTYVGTVAARTQPVDWKRWAGVLKDSPNLNDDPVAIQQAMRHEWD
jgi:predicted DNA-binding antitoxin AbrB/MazE fold protein